MSEQEKAKLIEEHLPSLESIIDEYRAQGKALTTEEAEAVREQLRKDLASGHLDAMENVLGDDVLDKIAGGAAINCVPTGGWMPTPTPTPTPGPYTYGPRV